ncbi:hypothetical protein GIB67_020251 [Kingdonia uniflora]|uniref:Uncharacterized protein n=1 Tax=Kingdonia uniflora TaxID=39325 RepID=A0A7J7P3P4_9MAGN|nr:hypothetical protein GIB67_020251 [Kingdonia uniflora]
MNTTIELNNESPVISEIPVDLIITKKCLNGNKHRDLTFSDASDNLIFRVDGQSLKSIASRNNSGIVLLDAGDHPLITICSNNYGGWQGFKGDSAKEEENIIFRVEKTIESTWKRELEVNMGESKSCLKIRGSPFQRNCTVYENNSIVAQTSKLYKLGKIIVGRRKFRLTIFPGRIEHLLIIALNVIFFYGYN